MISIGKRIRYLRKEIIKLTLKEFAQKLSISGSNLGNIETGVINATDRVIADICTAFNVSEEWLRTGQGEIMSPKSKSIVDELDAVYRLDERRKNLLKNFLSLKDEEQELIVDALEVMASISPQKNATDADSKHIDEVVDALTLSRADAIRLINAAYDRREKETLDAG